MRGGSPVAIVDRAGLVRRRPRAAAGAVAVEMPWATAARISARAAPQESDAWDAFVFLLSPSTIDVKLNTINLPSHNGHLFF